MNSTCDRAGASSGVEVPAPEYEAVKSVAPRADVRADEMWSCTDS